jgi:uncharacterized protein with NRDE domain
MCIAYLALSAHPDWPLFIAANRDEFHARPCIAAAPRANQPDIISGIDVLAGGTWLGVTRSGRYALITNYRDPARVLDGAPSRGELVSSYLRGIEPPQDYVRAVQAKGAGYNGFNLIVGDRDAAWYAGNRASQPQARLLAPGRYVLSNHLLDTPWPKARRLRTALDAFPLEALDPSLTPIFDALRDTTAAQDAELPATGLPLERERLLSSPFIVSDTYGTRCSSVLAIHADGHAIFSEVSYDETGRQTRRHDWPFSTQGN